MTGDMNHVPFASSLRRDILRIGRSEGLEFQRQKEKAMPRFGWITASLDAALPVAGAIAGLNPAALMCVVGSTFLLEAVKNYTAESQQLTRDDIDRKIKPVCEHANLSTQVLPMMQAALTDLAVRVQQTSGDMRVIVSTVENLMDGLKDVSQQAARGDIASVAALGQCQSLERHLDELKKEANVNQQNNSVHNAQGVTFVQGGTINHHHHYYPAGTDTTAHQPAIASASAAQAEMLSKEACILLIEVSKDASGYVLHIKLDGGTALHTNGKTFPAEQNPREEARWVASLRELEGLGLLEAQDSEVFRVTDTGYTMAESLGHPQ